MSDESATQGLRIARGPVLQVHPADREKRLSSPARQPLEVPVRVRNVGTEPLALTLSATAAWVEVPRPELRLEPGAAGQALFRVSALALEPGSYSFTAVLKGAQLLGDQELVRVSLEISDPVRLVVRERGAGATRARAWDTAWIELEARRSDGQPCTVSAVSADPWPHWLLRSEIRRERDHTLVRLLAQAPGRGPARTAELTLTAAEAGIQPAQHRIHLARQSGPVLVWSEEPDDPVTREKLARDDPEWAEQALTLPDLLPGDSAAGAFHIRNVGDEPAVARITVESRDGKRSWLQAGFGPEPSSSGGPEITLAPGEEAAVWTRLEAPLPLDRWVKDETGRTRRGRTPARELSWPGAVIRIEAEGAPQVLSRPVSASILGALQPVPLESRVLPAAVDLGLSLFAAALVYIAGWTLLGDYGLARWAEPWMAALHARFYSLAGGLALVLWWLLYALLLTGCQGVYGTTPGKAYAGMEIRRPDGSKPGPLRSALRGFLTALLLPVLCWSAAFGWKGNWVDRWLGTRVVRVASLWDE